MENYEKKYKEALERAKKLHEEAIILQLEQDIKDYEYIFPQLKKSKDEKIKKALIHLINEQDGFLTAIDGISVKDILAWLEKQGDIDRRIQEEIEKQTKQQWKAEKQGEQKVWENVEPVTEDDKLHLIMNEQNPAWSEEDEETLGWLCTFLKKYGITFYNGNEENVIDWLKSLKDRMKGE